MNLVVLPFTMHLRMHVTRKPMVLVTKKILFQDMLFHMICITQISTANYTHTYIYIHWDQIDWIQQKIASVSHLDLVHWISGDPKLGYLGCKPLGVPVQPCLIFVRNKRFSACK